MELSTPLHPLLQVLRDAADGRFPAVDGEVMFVPPLSVTNLSTVDFSVPLDVVGA